jgi:hypothetical protein
MSKGNSMAEKRCVKCILSSSFPGIRFDGEGVCNFCTDEIIEKTSDSAIAAAAVEARALIERVRGKKDYDAIVCYSGGKDSTYTLMKAVREYDLRVLSFTLDNGFLSPLALRNINTVVERLAVDHIFFKPSKELYAGIIRTSLTKPLYARSTARRISAGCQSCISIVNNMALKIAMEKDIPLILAGFTLGQIPTDSILFRNNYEFLRDSRSRSLEILRNEVGEGVLRYFTVPQETLDRVKDYPHTVNLLVIDGAGERDILKAIAPLGWEQPRDVDGCSSNCTLNVLNNYAHERQYRFNPYELELSHLVRKGQLDRAEALSKILDQSPQQLAVVMQALGLEPGMFDYSEGKKQ